MPHQCTNCARTFEDGSTEMLSGCPDCGGNKFQFQPDDADAGPDPGAEPDEQAPDPPDPPTSSTVAETVGKTAATVRDIVGGSGPPGTDREPGRPGGGRDADPDAGGESEAEPAREDTAQASARTDVVSPDEIPTGADAADGDHQFRPVRTDSDESDSAERDGEDGDPDLADLRAELNDQFESIKVLGAGQYELNLMELYDREEYIIALQEDGRYTVQVPENFID